MHLPFVCLISSYVLGIGQSTITTNSLNVASEIFNASSLNSRLPNLTAGIPDPPPNFGLEYNIGGAKLNVTACLMNTISALKELALGDWLAAIADGTEYRLDSYPEVGIVFNTARRKRTIQARCVIWAIVLGVYSMIDRKRFEFAQFEMSWDREVIGWVHVVDQPSALGLTRTVGIESNETIGFEERAVNPRMTNNTKGLDVVDVTNIINTSDLTDTEDSRLTLSFGAFGNTLSIFDVFVPVMVGLSDLAANPSTHTAPGLVVALQGRRTGICMFPTIPERTSPPFLEYRWLIRALVRIPMYMFQEHMFGDVNIKMDVDGIGVGWGRLSKIPCESSAPAPSSVGVEKS